MKLNEKIAYARKKAGLTQENVAREIGVTLRNYQRFESGEIKPKDRRSLERALKTPFGYLEDEDLSAADRIDYIKSAAHTLMADGMLSEVDLDAFTEALTEISEEAERKKAELAGNTKI